MSRVIQPRLECEIGFVIGRRLKGPWCTIFDLLNATDYVVPTAEIVDGREHRIDRETDKPRTVLDSIAGNAALIVGGRPMTTSFSAASCLASAPASDPRTGWPIDEVIQGLATANY